MTDRLTKDLLAGVRKRQPESFDQLYELYKAPIFNFVYQLVGDAEEAKDITQESFLAIYNVLKEKKKVNNLKAYLYAIARNNSIQRIEKRSREFSDEDFITRLPDENYYADPVRFSSNRKQQVDIARALQMMPDNYREVLILREQAGFSYESIASMLGTNKTNVGVLIYRARAKFRELYRMLQITQEPATVECESMLPLISSWLDGETSRKQEQELQRHMAECPFCKLASEQMVDASSTYHSLIPLAVPFSVKAGLMAQAGLAGVVPTSLAASAAGAAGTGSVTGGASLGVAATSMPAGASVGSAGFGAAAAGTTSAAAGISAKAMGIALAAVIAAGAIGGGTYADIRVQAHRHVVALELQLKAQIDDFVKGTRSEVEIPAELRKKAQDLQGAARRYIDQYLSDMKYRSLEQFGSKSDSSAVVKVIGLSSPQSELTTPTNAVQALDCYLEVLKQDGTYQVDRMTKNDQGSK
jgi:RNA polymerase sigma-70 factor (ECF subfamily)